MSFCFHSLSPPPLLPLFVERDNKEALEKWFWADFKASQKLLFIWSGQSFILLADPFLFSWVLFSVCVWVYVCVSEVHQYNELQNTAIKCCTKTSILEDFVVNFVHYLKPFLFLVAIAVGGVYFVEQSDSSVLFMAFLYQHFIQFLYPFYYNYCYLMPMFNGYFWIRNKLVIENWFLYMHLYCNKHLLKLHI